MNERTARGRAWRTPTNHSGFGNGYDAELVNVEVLAVCDHYLTERRREGRRYVYTCPDCGKPDFEVEPVKGLAGCFNPACSMPTTTGALGIISHLEGLERGGRSSSAAWRKATRSSAWHRQRPRPSDGRSPRTDGGPRRTGRTRRPWANRETGGGSARTGKSHRPSLPARRSPGKTIPRPERRRGADPPRRASGSTP